jgi:hypothetical protein
MNSWVISGIILLVGFFICLILILRSKWNIRRKNIDDYQDGRDKLTYRKKKIVVEEESSDGISLGSLVGAFITILVGVSMLGTIKDEISLAINSTSELAASSTILQLVPIIFALAIGMVAIGMVVSSLKDSGMI